MQPVADFGDGLWYVGEQEAGFGEHCFREEERGGKSAELLDGSVVVLVGFVEIRHEWTGVQEDGPFQFP